MKNWIRKIIFKFTEFLVLKFFQEGVKPIYSSEYPYNLLAYQWTWKRERIGGKGE